MSRKHLCVIGKQSFYVRENSFIARLAAYKLRSHRVAIVLGKTIHLWNTTKEEFLANEKWVLHELTHIRQYKQHGFLRFIFLYLIESIRNGYTNNRFEVEARKSEADKTS